MCRASEFDHCTPAKENTKGQRELSILPSELQWENASISSWMEDWILGALDFYPGKAHSSRLPLRPAEKPLMVEVS